jgi:XTP/dITP diphosphohydrolase
VRLVLASRNPHKLRELRALLRPHELVPLPEGMELPAEAGRTFAENALAKARAAAAATGGPAVADDSGIEAAALGGAPGIRSARYAGEGASDAENLAKLLRELDAAADRRVAYVCALAYVAPDGNDGRGGGRPDDGGHAGDAGNREWRATEHLVEGRCEGVLAMAPRGAGGFGYDPAFVPADREDDLTMAELSREEKDAISHRGRAARALLAWLEERD